MDIHRCRFVPYPPSTINVLAFSHSHVGKGQKVDTLRLAIGRANGDIEIWNPLQGAWFQETILRGGKDRSVDGLVWIQDPDEEDSTGKIIAGKLRLFSIGYTTTVTEWNLERAQPLRQSSGNHGEIWCLAAQPRLSQSQQESNGAVEQWNGQNLITGCTDGALVLYSTADDDLKLQRVLVRPSAKKAKVISINFQDRNIVVAGCTDSTIRVYDTRNGTSLRSISLGSGPSGGPKEIIVWAVKCLPNGNIVSGDSTGEVRIWDGKTYTLTQRIKSHRQDVLSLATSTDGSTILSGGMDRRTVVYKQVADAKSRWAEVTHKRFHSHDVKTMSTFEGKGMSFVVSGGPDASPIVIPLREFGLENQRTLPCLPQDPVVQSAPSQRLLVSWWDREVHIWRISKLNKVKEVVESESESDEKTRKRKLVAKILIKGEANITSASVAANGLLLVVATTTDVKLFRLRSRKADGNESLRVSKLDVPHRVAEGGARLVQFSPDGRWLILVSGNGRILSVPILGDIANPNIEINASSSFSKLLRIDRKIEKRLRLGGLGSYERTINRIAFSSDSRILAVSDLSGYVDTWVLNGAENLAGAGDDDTAEDASSDTSGDSSDSEDDESRDQIVQHWRRNPSASSLPKLPAAAVVLSFRPVTLDAPNSEYRLLAVTATSKIFEFEVLNGSLSSWSRSNPTAKFPDEFKDTRDQAMGCLWDVEGGKERLWLYGTRWLFMFDLSRDFPAQEKSFSTNRDTVVSFDLDSTTTPNRKRKRSQVPDEELGSLKKGTSGAGGKIPDELLGTGMSRKMQRVLQEVDNEEVQQLDTRSHQDIDMLVEDSDDENIALTKPIRITLSALDQLRGAADASIEAVKDDTTSNEPPHWWHTYKYRPIMGIVPIEGSGTGLEVALVERPEWELDLPPRYYGSQEWEKPGL